jgi:hypothetical protein
LRITTRKHGLAVNKAGGDMLRVEESARQLFELGASDLFVYDLTRLAGGEYASCFTEWAWKIYWKGINDSHGAFQSAFLA